MPVGDGGFDFGSVVAFGHSRRDDEIDAVGKVAELGVHSCEADLDLFGSAAGGSPDADPSASRDGDRGIEGVGEAEDRMGGAQIVTERGVKRIGHGGLLRGLAVGGAMQSPIENSRSLHGPTV